MNKKDITPITRRFKTVYSLDGKIIKKEGGWILVEGLDEPASISEKYSSNEIDPITKNAVSVERVRTVNLVPSKKLICFRKDSNAATELKVNDVCTFFCEIDIGWDSYNKKPELRH